MSAKNYSSHATASLNQTTTKPIRGKEGVMVKNDSGHFVFQLPDLAFLERFLVLGSLGGTYNCDAQTTFDSAMDMLVRLRESDDALVALNIITEMSVSGRAPRNDPAIFALVVFTASSKVEVKKAAYKALPDICRTGTHLFTFMEMVKGTGRGYGQGMKKAVGRWYTQKNFGTLCYQIMKYRNREGWTHRDVLRKVRPKTANPALNALFKFVCFNPNRKEAEYLEMYGASKQTVRGLDARMNAFIDIQEAGKEAVTTLALNSIRDHNMPWETLPTQALASADIWAALVHKAPMGALMRNLGRISKLGLTTAGSPTEGIIVERFSKEAIQGARLHPINILLAMKTYASGHGIKGSSTWVPSQRIVDALDQAFYFAFANVPVTGKRFYLGLDLSGSMTAYASNGLISCIEGAAAMALVTMDAEEKVIVKGFATKQAKNAAFNLQGNLDPAQTHMVDLPLSTRRRLDDNVGTALSTAFGATILCAPIEDAIANDLEVDTFVIYTDNETNTRHGIHPMISLDKYRKKTGIDAKLIVVGMQGRPFSIADPEAPYTMDVVGFDAACPSIISAYSGINTKIQ